ncbi:MAG: peptide deformylase [Acidobacteriota bacterium]
MAILQILKYPSNTLLASTKPVERIDDSIRDIIRDMFETMYAAPGVGLAANQVGIPLRIAVIDVAQEEDKRSPKVLINPEVLNAEGLQFEEEGCLSLPGFTEVVERPLKMTVLALNLQGEEYLIEGGGLMARALSHEIDHLNGKVFISRLSMLKRDFIKRQIRKMMKSGEWTGVIE